MTTEEIIDCPKTQGNLCYKTQMSPELTTYLSLSCGFWTNSLMKKGEEFYEQQMESLPELYKDLAWEDPDTELIWIPNTINNPEYGMVFAYGTNKDSWGWGAVKAIQLTEEESKNHPIPGKPGEFMKHTMDMTNMKVYHERDYIDALSYIKILPE